MVNLPYLRQATHWPHTLVRNRAALIFITIGAHVGILLITYFALYTLGIIQHIPNEVSLQSWDAGLFYRLSQTGYDDASSAINAFFPLLPVVWKLTGLNAVGISIMNGACGCIGVGILAWAFRLSARQILVSLSAPMLFFVMVPYAEALFFMLGALFLAGLHRNQYGLVIVGLLGACLARSAATLFIPAYLFAELLWWNQQPWHKSILRILGGILAMASAVGIVMLMQYNSHGDAWAFYKVHSLWGQTFKEPTFPFHSSAGINVLWLDSFGLLIALCSMVFCLGLGYKWLLSGRKKFHGVVFPSRAVLFSLGYCFGAGFFIIFYQGGDLVGLARYILASPFFVVLLWQIWQLPPRQKVWLVGLLFVIYLLVVSSLGGLWEFNSFYPRQAILYYALFFIYVVIHLAVSSNSIPWYREMATGLYLVNLLLLIYFHVLFTQSTWIN
ncbi:hypothetical protein MTX78_13340 [Hymenobacter tibetensis]|uniref:Glycosyltransferase RgtA/B/C/D-like domain-containing protein n=1 Tax=Hymenobacter tibetensis TaxID=497967 RepID=A0ABY4CVU9_9BACT|nr:hypothetical protein [Hymenobacter tibetensis]UOG73109.1 hypothetical protein MTX78_13340 [Hymenobacter tibetensis]